MHFRQVFHIFIDLLNGRWLKTFCLFKLVLRQFMAIAFSPKEGRAGFMIGTIDIVDKPTLCFVSLQTRRRLEAMARHACRRSCDERFFLLTRRLQH